MPNTVEPQERPRQPVIRDKEFAKRLESACEANPHCPTDEYRGKKKWIYDNLEEQFGIKVSAEAVRKWFAGEARPRRKVMTAVARLLEVDEGWLYLGIKPELDQKEKKARNAVADAAVNVVAGIIQMQGAHIAFPDEATPGVDLYAIVNGKQRTIVVRMAFDLGQDRYRFTINDTSLDNVVIGLFKSIEGFTFNMVHLSRELVEKHGQHRGDFREIAIERRGLFFRAGDDRVPEIIQIKDVDGTVPQPPPQRR